MMVAMPMQPGYQQPQVSYGGPQGQWTPQPGQPQTAAPYYKQSARGGAGDRLPAQPDMMRRPAQAALAQQASTGSESSTSANIAARNDLSSGPKRTEAIPQSVWKPIHMPTPNEMGIALNSPAVETSAANPILTPSLRSAALHAPEHYDLATVTAWLDQQGAKMCQREKLAEGVQLHCSFSQGTVQQDRIFTAHGSSDEAALRELVREVSQWKETEALR